jgi:hypothetical protein
MFGGMNCDTLGWNYFGGDVPALDCNASCQIVDDACDTGDASAPCGSRFVEIGVHCNENLRPPTPEHWAVSCLDLGFAGGDLICEESVCRMDLSGCN